MEDNDTREFDDKDTEVVDAQVIEPPQDADDNDDEYEKVCFVCRRPESKTGKMITMQGNLHICPDCMQKTFDTMKNAGFDFDGAMGDLGSGMPDMSKFPNIGMINLADLDRFLIRPLPVGLQLLTARIDFDGLNKMFLATALFLLSQEHCNICRTPGTLLLLLFFLAEACMIRTCMIWIASCASFWIEGSKNSLNFLVISLGELAKYPLSIYPFPLRALFGYLIPYAFVSFYPVGYLLGKPGMTPGLWLTPVICLIFFFLSRVVLHAGLRRYESAT